MRNFIAMCVIVAGMAASGEAQAGAPPFVPLQGFLTDSAGDPISGTVSASFAFYSAPDGGAALWSETQTLIVDNGSFVVYLGFSEPLDLSFFIDQTNLWLGIKIEDDKEMQRVFIATVPFSAYAEHCGQVPTHTHESTQVLGIVKSGQLCPAGEVVSGFDSSGNVVCAVASGGGTYTGANFALSGQYCPPNSAMTGVDHNGYPVCIPAGGTNLNGKSCYGDEVMTGIDGNGNLICDSVAGGESGIDGSGSTKYLPKFKDSDTLEKSIIYESSNKIGINDTSPSQTLDINGNLRVSGEIHWGGNKFTSSSCLVVGGSSCSSACSAHGMSCYKAFAIDKESTSTSCSQSGFKFCCCKD